MTPTQALPVVRRYHEGWTSKNYEQAIDLLAPSLKVEVPINDYPTAESFAQALRSFGDLVAGVEMLSEMSHGDEAILLYDMQVQQLGTLRVAEHFTVTDGRITRLRQIHDTARIRAASAALTPARAQDTMNGAAPGDYTRDLQFRASRTSIFEALTTLDGLAGWWTPLLSGNPNTGGEVEFAFAGLAEKIVMRVDDATSPARVTWTCLLHTGHPEWQGTKIIFELTQVDDEHGVLAFRHVGLNPRLHCYDTCERGWERFLASLVSYAQHGEGSPF
jgi:uncharacterized protein YndB with AHSA1/START domain